MAKETAAAADFTNSLRKTDIDFGSKSVRVSQPEHLNKSRQRRKLGQMFGAIENNKDQLHIQDYSISQTSLEQIFNQFAAQQDEEKGVVI